MIDTVLLDELIAVVVNLVRAVKDAARAYPSDNKYALEEQSDLSDELDHLESLLVDLKHLRDKAPVHQPPKTDLDDLTNIGRQKLDKAFKLSRKELFDQAFEECITKLKDLRDLESKQNVWNIITWRSRASQRVKSDVLLTDVLRTISRFRSLLHSRLDQAIW
jgi:hypothetical protein